MYGWKEIVLPTISDEYPKQRNSQPSNLSVNICKCQWIFCCNGSLCKVLPDVKSTGGGQLNKDKNQDPGKSLNIFLKCWHAEHKNSLAKSPKIQWGKRFISANYFEKMVRVKLNAPRTKVQISDDKLFKSVQVLNSWAEHMSAKN